ncbi:MAG: tetratricopeptide repeat protein [Planctomycetota bacterium]|nr:MAG: tetratricopeptide repeat protein [Planctomycetota bacterium]REJ93746.1 MAG: tetratricopeptide repeat protein [Planctomycetota bacterium]REK27726.1 MAG: tetratricopeptide repeat protein [Planctomycetota bacterium]REK48133.1 MAG: tetratricopeptide repeat protein [Planctomycetota bacterium]
MSNTGKLFVGILILAIVAPVTWIAWRGPFTVEPSQPGGDIAELDANVSNPTFARHIAPLMFARCAVCHRPGEAAPFSLLSYDDVAKRGEQILEVTRSRYMPPWQPEPGHFQFVGERRLSDAQLAMLAAWVEQGMPEGDRNELPPRPEWPDDWQLGEPDLVITMPEVYILPAEGQDVFRNFVLPIPVATTRYVRAVELRPGNKRIVHHASMFVDRSRSTRLLDKRDPEPGFEGMEVGDARYPDGHFLGWTPGKTPDPGVPGISWRVDPGADLVLQLHMLPGGKPEPIQASVGLYFDEEPRTSRRAYTLFLKADEQLDIPAGESEFRTSESFRLPIDVEALIIYPHAHYLGKEVRAVAALPDGDELELLRIKDWDFNWQDSYRYQEPVGLPKGTTISMRWVFDNSADNPRNPSHPPQRVGYGNRSTDEMSHLYLQVLLQSEREENLMKLAEYRQRLAKHPGDWASHTQLGRALESLNRLAEAMAAYRAAIRLQPDYALARQSLALALAAQGKPAEALEQLEVAVRLNPDDSRARFRLAHALNRDGQTARAVQEYQEVAQRDPYFAEAHNNLAWLLATSRDAELRDPDAAVRHAAMACELVGNREAAYLDTSAAAYAAQGDFAAAVAMAERARRLALAGDDTALAKEFERNVKRYEQQLPPWQADEAEPSPEPDRTRP